MNELFEGLIGAPLWLVLPLAVILYLTIVGILRALLRPAIVNNLDPLHITLILFMGPGLIGFLIVPALTHVVSQSFIIILAFLGVWLLVIRFAGKPTVVDLRDRMGPSFQATLLVLTIAIVVANVIVNMIIPGTIPLFTEGGGSASRFEATTNSRLLSWLSYAIAPTAGVLYALTQNLRIRKLAAIAVALQVGAGLLFASKAAILSIIFIFLNSLFIASARNDQARYKELRRKLITSSIVVAMLVPVYLSIIGFGGGAVAASVAIRFLTGFDQLIYASQLDLLRNRGFEPLLNTNIIEYQLMPYFKALFSAQYDYANVGQYILEYVTGIKIEGPSTFPNSNLILETVFTSGTYPGALIFLVELAVFYWYRRVALAKPVTAYSLVLVQCMALNPFGLFLSGQEWLPEMILMCGTVVAALVLSDFWTLLLRISRSDDIVPRLEAAP